MPTCNQCGEEIEFRYVNGRCVPIHPGGGWHCGFGASASYLPPVSGGEWEERDFTRPTRCPKCHKSVFFIRHNGGSVWVNPPLGWPWPKHGCFDQPGEPTQRFSLWTAKSSRLTNPKLGVITRINNVELYAEPILEIRFTDDSRATLILRYTPPDSSLLGSLVIVSKEDELLLHQELGEFAFHSLTPLSAPAPPSRPQVGPTADRVWAAVDSVSKQAWAAVAQIEGTDAQLKQAKQEALRLIAMLSPAIKRQVEYEFTSEKWRLLVMRRQS